MYLFVFVGTGQVRQVHDNLSTGDLLAIKDKSLRIFTIDGSKFVEVVIDKEKLCIVPVTEGHVIQCKEGRVHHP